MITSDTKTAKIGDFGVSFFADTNQSSDLSKTVGSPAFFAPELCTDDMEQLLQFHNLIKNKTRARRQSNYSRTGSVDQQNNGPVIERFSRIGLGNAWSSPCIAPPMNRSDSITSDTDQNAVVIAGQFQGGPSSLITQQQIESPEILDRQDGLVDSYGEGLRDQELFSDTIGSELIEATFPELDSLRQSHQASTDSQDGRRESKEGPDESSKTATQRPVIGKQIDVWALGVTLYCIIYGHLPYVANNEFELFGRIAREPVIYPTDGPRGDIQQSDPLLMDMLQRFLEKDPDLRIRLHDAIRHRWIQDAIPGATEEEKERWIQDASPERYGLRMVVYGAGDYDEDGRIRVTDQDVEAAVTVGAFKRLFQNIKRRLSRSLASLFPSSPGSRATSESEDDDRSTTRRHARSLEKRTSRRGSLQIIRPVAEHRSRNPSVSSHIEVQTGQNSSKSIYISFISV